MQQAEIGIIGGSGLYTMPGLSNPHQVEVTTPFGDPSDVFMAGELEGRQVVFLARHGRGHRILPTELNFRANIFAMKKLGVERIISVSAVGSLKLEHKPTEFVVPDQFIDRTIAAQLHLFRRRNRRSRGVWRSSLRHRRQGHSPRRTDRRSRGKIGRRLRLHGRPTVLHPRRIESLSQLGRATSSA